jgi:hypothetical protein
MEKERWNKEVKLGGVKGAAVRAPPRAQAAAASTAQSSTVELVCSIYTLKNTSKPCVKKTHPSHSRA